ncbi:D-alanyl-D-alanine carboxypeptidase [Microbacterium trichothecenolyticum]|uniref:serine hydrolase domain-containing protein n=1 Tax=Microbacterium trichothecenolyticum TaxID=69370 RepID=UPI00285C1721|nr:serine hydrolase domain-containing protein [Microbacterium trichothecenolyticum]MDR7186781.1 D-alanyl-D-alanine carboxypeptidase [Microbacterium trichothecenolyticum]
MPKSAARPTVFALSLVVALTAGLAACGSPEPDAAPSATTEPGALAVVEDGLGDEVGDALAAAATEAFDGVSAPGAVMAIRTPEGTWAATIGYQDWDKTIPMTADVNQRVGSVTKTFTITALLQLAEQGELSLDDPIEMYIPGMPNGDATLYDLASMRSGIPSYTFDQSFQETLFSDPNHVWTPQELVDLVKGTEPMYPPGSMTFYSNTNTVLLGMVIEKVTGKPIQDVMREQITEPLGLSATFFPTDASFPDPHAHGYTTQGTDDNLPVEATDWNPSWGWSAGAMISDLDDLLTWGEALATGEGILSPEWQATRLDSFDFDIPVYLGPDKEAPQSEARAYGLGLGLALGWYGHTGELMGYNTVVQHHAESGTTLIVMVDSDIKSGECPADAPTTPGGRTTGPCEDPAVHIANALADAAGHPLVESGN